MNDRLTDLEITCTHLERTVQELDEVICRHQQTIDRLEAELLTLKDQVLLVAPSLTKEPGEEEPPPHY
jgi:uncharacterized coiled-coil protein SlyX